MAANEIKIVIGGDPKGFQKAARDVSTATDRMRVSFKDAAAGLPGLNNAVEGTANNLKKVIPGANQAGAALTNLGRVAQDAPFGFIGIQNNINPLLESFQRLKQETGSTGAAFKALGSSLIGAGGLGLAVSLVTSALSFFAMSAGGAKEKLEGYAKAIDEANKKAGDEIARVQILNAVITDNTRSQLERTNAAAELSKTLEDLNIKMTKEEILNGNVAKATQLATAAIIERAKARAAEARIGELSAQQLERETKRIKLADDLAKAEKRLNDVRAKGSFSSGGATGGVGTAGGTEFTAERIAAGAKDALAALDKQTEEANKEIERLIGLIKTEDLTIDLGGGEKGKKDLDLLKQRIEALKQLQSLTGLTGAQQVELAQLEIQLAKRDAVKLGFTPEELQQQVEGILEKAFPVATFEFPELLITGIGAVKFDSSKTEIQKAFTEGFKTDIAGATGSGQIEIPAPKFVFTNLQDSAKIAREQLRDILFSALLSGIQEGSALIGEAFAGLFSGEGVTSALAKAAQGLLGIVGGILQEVGKQIIATSTLIKALKAAIGKLLGPGGEAIGLAVGAALIATGALLKNIKFNVPKLADGGIATGATLGIFGEAGKEAIIPLDKLPQMMGKLNLASNNQPIVLNGNLRVTGTDLSLLLERADNRRRRLG